MTSRHHGGPLGRLSRTTIAIGVLLGALSFAVTPGVSQAASVDGAVDTTFNASGLGANGTILSVAFTSDEKIYIAGEFTSYNGFSVGGIARLNPNGNLDLTFNFQQAGFAKNSGLRVASISVDSDGKIYAVGSFTSYNGTTIGQDNVVRLNADGTLDTAFISPRFESSNFPGSAASMSLVKKVGDLVLVSGGFDTIYTTANPTPSTSANGLVALTTSGAIDTTFGVNARLRDGLSTSMAYNVIPVSNSTDIYVQGSFKSVNSEAAFFVTRLKNDGTRSTEYNNAISLPNNSISGIAVQSDGKLLFGGNFTQFNGVTTAKGLIRVNPDATLDTSFTSPASSLIAVSLAVDENKRIYVAGGIGTGFGTSSSRAIVRLNADGSLDSSFDLPLSPVGYENKVALSPTGKVFIYGNFTKLGDTTLGRIARISSSAPQSSTPSTSVPSSEPNVGVVTPPPAVVEAPGKPTNIKVVLKSNQATVSWDLPTTGGAPSSYTATATLVGARAASVDAVSKNASSTLSCSASAPATACVIKGLQGGQKYGFSVSAANVAGVSPKAAVAKPIAIPVSIPETLPETGAGYEMWLMLSAAALLLAVGVAMRRGQLS